MRLKHLSIPSYRNLRSFEINFDESQPTTVLLGRNGSGKSNLIEAIVEIFRELELGHATTFVYSMTYECHGHRIEIAADPSKVSRRLVIQIDGEQVPLGVFRKNAHEYLPQHVFGYYSGWSSRLERQFDPPTRRRYRELLTNTDDDMPVRRFLFCRKQYSQLALLAFFVSSDPRARQLLAEHLHIDALESALFVLKKPWWGGRRGTRPETDADRRFWNASGAFLPFLRRLWEESLAPVRSTEIVERTVPRDAEQTDRIYLFIKNQERLAALLAPFEGPKAFFGNLESLYLCDLIDEVRVVVRKRSGEQVRFAQLSEGEQQLLTVLGLLLFTQDDESLYLLDEPDTHLNPVWTYDFLNLIESSIQADKGQLIIATHNPLMIGSLRKNQVRILTKHEGNITAAEPDYDPIGVGVEGLLKSELYGLRSSLAPEVLKKLDRHYLLLGKREMTEAEQSELVSLANELNELGIARTHPNPYFEQFANAVARRAPQPRPPLSKEEIDEQAELVDEVLAEVLAEERADAGRETT